MTPEQAAWVREQAWTPAMRRDHGEWTHLCACQYGPSSACHTGDHDWCHHWDTPGWAIRTGEGWITDAHTRVTADWAQIWAVGCCGTSRCNCTCHTTPRPGQTALDMETA